MAIRENEMAWKKYPYLLKEVQQMPMRSPANANAKKLKKDRWEQTKTYQKERLEYIEGQINKITISVEDRLSQIVWKTINEVGGRKSTPRAKLKAVSHQERR